MNCGNILGHCHIFLLVQQIDALKLMTKAELVNWFMGHRGEGNRKLSVHVRLPAHHSLEIYLCIESNYKELLY